MRFIIYGAGGIGCVIGGHLFRQGETVALVGNAQHMDAINARGLKLVTGDANYVLKMPAYKSARELLPFQDDDIVFLCAKSQHTIKCLGQLKSAGAPRTLAIFCAQNSIVNEAVATRFFDRVYGVMIMIPAIFMTPGEVINPIVRRNGVIEIGRYPTGADDVCQPVADALRRAGFFVNVNANVMTSKAAKCLLNLGNAFDAINDGAGDSRAFLQAVRAEAMQVWRAAGIEWEESEQFTKRVRSKYGERRVPAGYENLEKRSSSWQSLARGTGNIEAEQLNGDVVMLGENLGIATPYNETLWRLAAEMAMRGDPPGKYSANELMKMVQR